MARPLRIEYEGAFHHVLSRGNERRNIFTDDKDRTLFVELLAEMSERFEVEIYAYILMSNHYHLLLKTNRSNLSKSMQWFGTTYTRRYNVRHRRSGHLFQGRFKNILLESDVQIMVLSFYIHRNPLRAKMVKRLVDYKWSSYLYYAYGKYPVECLEPDCIFSLIKEQDKHQAYRRMVQEYSKEEKNVWEDLRHGLIFGSQKFVDKIRSKYLSEKPDIDIPQKRQILKGRDPEVILKKGADFLKCNVNDFVNAGKVTGENKTKRDLLIYLLWNTGLYNNIEIGKLFSLGHSSISRQASVLKSKLSNNSQLRKELKSLNSRIKV